MANKEVSLSIPSAPGMELAATAQAEALGEAMRLSRDKIDEVKFALVDSGCRSGRGERRCWR